jgi:hypothetical protein
MMTDRFDSQIDFLKRYFEGLQKKSSEARKKGFDMRMAELRLMPIPHKLKYASVSRDIKDLDVVKKLLRDAEKEIPRDQDE